MSTIVIVHGAGSGGWIWKTVRRLLQSSDHEVYTPTLTGVGERAHLSRPEIGLNTHIEDILGLLRFEELSNVALIGHSYGGIVITGVADRAPERLSQLIYLDAFVPVDGQSLFDLVPATVRTAMEQQVQIQGEGWQVPPFSYPSLGQTGKGAIEADEAQQLLDKRVPQPVATYREPVHLTNPAAASLRRTYIHCTDKQPGDVLARFAEQARSSTDWRVEELATGHFPMLTMPRELTALLLQLV